MTVFALVAQPLSVVLSTHVADALSPVGSIKNVQSGELFTDFTSAINDAETVDGNTLRATGEFTVDSSIAVNKSLTITGQSAMIKTDSATNVFHVTASDVKINGFDFEKTGTAGDFRFINLVTSAVNAKVWDNVFHSGFNIGDGNTVRGLVVSPGTTGYDIRNNTFSHVRQPAYIDASTGTVRNNHTDNSKGWVVTSGSSTTFANNTWGTGADRNVLDIAIIAEATNNYPDSKVVQISNNNNDAVVENQFGGNKVLSDAYVTETDNGKSGDTGSAWHPYTKIQDAFSRIVEGGTVHVANGTYSEALVVKKQGTQLVGESRDGVKIAPLSNQYGQGLTSEGLSKISFSNFTINAASSNGGGYALKAHNGSNLKITNVTVNGAGPTVNMGGVDINGINGVVISNVTSQNFKKNGFAFSSRYDATDPFTRSVTLDNITAKNNGWAGVAFYATNNAGTVGHSFTNVAFTGANTISGNAKGLEVVGDSDANIANGLTPRYSILNAAGGPVDLASIDFANSSAAHIVNNQVTDLLASDATFDGKLQKDMILSELTTLSGKIFDKADKSYLGQVIVDTTGPLAPVLVSPADGAKVKGASVTQSWANGGSIDVDHYVYESYHDAALTNLRWREDINGTSKTATNVADATYWWRVKAVDHAGNSGAWSEVRKLTIDNTKPTATLDFSGTIPGATNFKVKFNEDVKKTDAENPANYFLHNWPGASSFESLAGHATVSYDEATTTATVTFTDPNWYVSGEQNWGVRNVHDIAGNQIVETSAYSSPINGPLMTSVTFNEDHNDVTWNWTADDGTSGSGIKGYAYKLVKDSSTVINDWTSTSNTSYFKHLDDGTYTFSVKSWDNAGNEGNTLNLSFTLDSTAPNLTMNTPVLNSDGSYTVHVTTDDPTHPVSFYLDGTLLTGATSNSDGTVWTVTTAPLNAETTHIIRAESSDGANAATPVSKQFTVPPVTTTTLGANIVPSAITQPTTNFAAVFAQPLTQQAQTEQTDTGVLGAETKKEGTDIVPVTATPQGWKIFGIAWYWILLTIVVLGSAAWWGIASARRRAAQDV